VSKLLLRSPQGHVEVNMGTLYRCQRGGGPPVDVPGGDGTNVDTYASQSSEGTGC